jgi:hypothetical protein
VIVQTTIIVRTLFSGEDREEFKELPGPTQIASMVNDNFPESGVEIIIEEVTE